VGAPLVRIGADMELSDVFGVPAHLLVVHAVVVLVSAP
jgi:hypothetical protein